MVRKMLRCVIFWIPVACLTVFCILFWMWSMHNIRLVVTGVKAVAQMAAEAVDADAAGQVAEQVLLLRRDAPQGAVSDYTADEQVVLLGRYTTVEKMPEWQMLREYLEGVSGHYSYAEEFSLVYSDRERGQLIWLAAPGHATGYCAWNKDLAFPDENGYDVGTFVGRREGTVVLVPIPGQEGEPVLYICGRFSFGGIMGSEAKRMLIPLITTILFTALCSARVFFLFWCRKMQETEEKNTEERTEDAEENAAEKETTKDEIKEEIKKEITEEANS